MSRLLAVLRQQPAARALAAFNLLFFAGMWLSKTAHPLYFEAHGSLVLFGVSYTAMAVAGAFSVVLGRLADQWGPRRAMRYGCVAYAAGLALRVVPDQPAVALVSGVVAGLGASAVFVGVRPWIMGVAEEAERPAFLAVRQTSDQLGTALGTAAAGTVVAVAGAAGAGYPAALLLAALGPLAAGFLVPPLPAGADRASPAGPGDGSSAGLLAALRIDRSLTLGVIALGALSGAYVSVLAPYLPVVLGAAGVPVAAVGAVLAAAVVVRLVAGAAFAGLVTEANRLRSFVIFEGASALAAFGLAAAGRPAVAVAFVLVRAFVLVGAVLSEELIQMSLFPAAVAGLYFGLAQSSFLAGDALGGALGGVLHASVGPHAAVAVSAVLTVVNATAYPVFVRRVRRRRTPPALPTEPSVTIGVAP